mgnify:FL=1|tara:strand:- start:221 stop:418 length:198 start_codon:yes stop_codon:yes gene_type:complete
MAFTKYIDDQLYRTASNKHIQNVKPSPSEGNDGDERWVSITGKGLYHCKKYAGEWRFNKYSENID